MKRIGQMAAVAIAAAAILAGCGAGTGQGGTDAEPPGVLAGKSGGTAGGDSANGGNSAVGGDALTGSGPAAGGDRAPDAAPDAGGAALDPEAARQFLERANIPNGDLYLQDGLLHVNIVGLDEAVKAKFAEAFPGLAYKLVDVRFTHEELKRAQAALSEHDLHRKLNLYSSSIDVIGNRLEITMPDSSDGAQAEIEKHIDPEMIVYHLEPLGEPQLVGAIDAIDEEGKRLLILVDGETEPSYWLSFNAFSVVTGASGETVDFDAFAEGDRVNVWIAGAVMESMPAQATARKVELVPAD